MISQPLPISPALNKTLKRLRMEENNNNHNNRETNGGINGVIRPHSACAACKHQRKKCPPDCLLAPYFPSDKKNEFESVRKKCSLKSLREMIKNVEAPEDRHRVAEAVTWVAGCWDEDRVLGAAGKYLRVLQQVEDLKRENAALRERLNNRIHQLARLAYSSPNGYVAHHHQDHSNGTVVYPQNYHLQAGPDPNGYQFCLPVQQQHSPSGYQYCLPEQLHDDVFDDTQTQGSP